MKLVTIPQLLLVAALAILVESSCKKRKFYDFPDKTYKGTFLYKFTKATQTVEQCQRMCNQVLKCTGFVMRWAGPQRGYCDFFNYGTSALEESDKGTTVYLDEQCPDGFVAYFPGSHCYKLVRTDKTYSNARAHCTGLHPNAYLVEIQSAEENNGVRELIVGEAGTAHGKIRLGARREAWASNFNAFRWEKSGVLVDQSTYDAWKPSSPDTEKLPNKEYCMYGDMISSNEMKWGDAYCHWPMPFVCELDI